MEERLEDFVLEGEQADRCEAVDKRAFSYINKKVDRAEFISYFKIYEDIIYENMPVYEEE